MSWVDEFLDVIDEMLDGFFYERRADWRERRAAQPRRRRWWHRRRR